MQQPELFAKLGFGGQVRNLVLLGEAGCGKSEIGLNIAAALVHEGAQKVEYYDLDMTKPLFRARDKADLMREMGVEFHFEEQFMDAPTAVGGVRRSLKSESFTILDVGGDHIGARFVGGYAPLINSPDTVVLYIINSFRPWAKSIESIDQVMGEILGVSHINLNQLMFVGNSNLGPGTTADEVISGTEKLTGFLTPYAKLSFICVEEDIARDVQAKTDLFVLPLSLRMGYPWDADIN